MKTFSERNKERCESPQGFNHPLANWSLSDWMTATVGELGEAANIIKKLNRHRDGVAEKLSVDQLKAMLADELADAETYLDLLFQAAGINKEYAVNKKFLEVSNRIDYLESLEIREK